MAGREHGEDIQGRPQGLHGHLDSRETALQHVTFHGWDKEAVFPQQPAEADPLIVQILGHCFPPALRRWRFFKSTEILKRQDTKSLTFPDSSSLPGNVALCLTEAKQMGGLRVV